MAHINGSKTSTLETGVQGEFKRKPSTYRNVVKKGGEFPPEAGRYHLYIAYACPWANRAYATMKMKGLDDSIGLSVVHPTWQRTKPDDAEDEHCGWTFATPGDPPFKSSTGHGSFSTEGCIPDTVNKPPSKTIRDLYEKANDTNGKYTVPVFWDKKTGTIVNNESSEILRFLNAEFQDLAKNPELDLYPKELRQDIDAVNDWIYNDINNGVYKCGFAQTQEAYDAAFEALFKALDRVEGILEKQRYLTGSQMTEADMRLFMTLIRFDEIYVVYFKTNGKSIREYPNISNYTKELFQMPGLGASINMAHCKMHYYTSHPTLNFFAVIPKGGVAWWKEPHDRASKFD